MPAEYSGAAIQSVLSGIQGFCKFLSANDTGATGGHRSGILISKAASEMLFTRQELLPRKAVLLIMRVKTG